MKKLLFLGLSLVMMGVSLAGKAPEPISLEGHWGVALIIGYPENKIVDEYKLESITKENKRGDYYYGNQIRVKEDLSFESYYTAPCGVDCFPKTRGRFERIDQNHMRIWLEFIQVHGMTCKQSEKTLNQNLGVFELIKEETGIRLVRRGNK